MMPVQLQMWLESFHESMILYGSDVICALSESKAKRSVSFSASAEKAKKILQKKKMQERITYMVCRKRILF